MEKKKCVFVYEANHIEGVVYVDVDSMKRAGRIDSPEFAEYLNIKAKLPTYKFEIKEFPKPNKNSYPGLSIRVMQAFIIQYEKNEQERKNALIELNQERVKGLLVNASYSKTKSWFLKKYGKAYKSSGLSKKEGKREELISNLLSSVDSELLGNSNEEAA